MKTTNGKTTNKGKNNLGSVGRAPATGGQRGWVCRRSLRRCGDFSIFFLQKI